MTVATEGPVVDPTKTHESATWKHDRPMTFCRFDPTGRFLFAGAEDNLVHRWMVADGTKAVFAGGHDSWVHAFAFAPDGKTVYSGGYDGRVVFWPAEEAEPKPSRRFQAHDGWVRGLAVSPDGKWLASAGNDNLVKIWSTADGSLRHTLKGHSRHVYAVAFHPDGARLVSGDLLGTLKEWDFASGKPIRDLDAKVLWKYDGTFRADIGGFRGMSFSPDGALLAGAGITDVTNAFAGVGKPLIVLFDWKTGKQKHLLRPKAAFRGLAWNVRFHRSGIVIAVGGGGTGGALWFWKQGEDKSFHSLKLKNNGRDMDMHPDQSRLAVAHADKTIRLYSMVPKPKA